MKKQYSVLPAGMQMLLGMEVEVRKTSHELHGKNMEIIDDTGRIIFLFSQPGKNRARESLNLNNPGKESIGMGWRKRLQPVPIHDVKKEGFLRFLSSLTKEERAQGVTLERFMIAARTTYSIMNKEEERLYGIFLRKYFGLKKQDNKKPVEGYCPSRH